MFCDEPYLKNGETEGIHFQDGALFFCETPIRPVLKKNLSRESVPCSFVKRYNYEKNIRFADAAACFCICSGKR